MTEINKLSHKIAILSCNTGGGHNAAGEAMAEAFRDAGYEAEVFDYLTLAGKGVSNVVGDTYVRIVKHVPLLFGIIYQIGMAVSKLTRKSPVYLANARMAKYLDRYFSEGGFSAVIMPHLYPAETITYMKRKGMDVPFSVYIDTDYTLIPFVEETDADVYVIPHEDLIAECVKRGIPGDKIRPMGIPVRKVFSEDVSVSDARKSLGLPEDGRVYLVVGGSMGSGHPGQLAEILRLSGDGNDTVVIVCGSNKKLYNSLSRRYKNKANVIVMGFTDRMPMLMKAADVVFTKPGGLSSTETAASRTPVVHVSPIPGCETENMRFFRSHGMSLYGHGAIRAASIGGKLASSERMKADMRAAQEKNINPKAAADIAGMVILEVEKRS